MSAESMDKISRFWHLRHANNSEKYTERKSIINIKENASDKCTIRSPARFPKNVTENCKHYINFITVKLSISLITIFITLLTICIKL